VQLVAEAPGGQSPRGAACGQHSQQAVGAQLREGHGAGEVSSIFW
jgi:hypothetical protein